MSIPISSREVLETIGMTTADNLDIRTVTMGINLLPASDRNTIKLAQNIQNLITAKAKDLVQQAGILEKRYGIPIVNKRITVTPISLLLNTIVTGDKKKDLAISKLIAATLDKTAQQLKVDFIGGYGALVEKGMTYADKVLIESLPSILNETETVCAFINVGSTKIGINMRAITKMGTIIHQTARGKNGSLGCAKLVVCCNAVSDNPFMAGGFHGTDQPDVVINVGISGPGVVRRVVERLPEDLPFDELASQIKTTAFKITRAGELIGKELALSLGVRFGSIDLSLAPTTEEGDSVGLILERMGLEKVGTHGTTAALALLTDSIKKGGVMASTHIGGLSGAFIPVAEDSALAQAATDGHLTLDKLEALTSVCSVGLDMIPVPGDTKTTTIAAIIADEAAIGMVNQKTTAVRVIPVQGKKAGDKLVLGGLFGASPILPVHTASSDKFVWRKGQIPAPITSFRN